jgi:hypothetical protein
VTGRKGSQAGHGMIVYDGRTAIGEIVDAGHGKVKAYALTESGRVSLGSFPTRREAMRAISINQPGGPEGPSAA